jgi:lysozyme
MNLNSKGLALLRQQEGMSLTAYWDVNGWAISRGLHYYANGRKVQQGDRFNSPSEAETEFLAVVQQYAEKVKKTLTAKLSDSQFSAVVNYAYNRGLGAWNGSTLKRMINKNPSDSNIKKQFVIEWGTNQNFKTSLQERRKKEGELYAENEPFNPLNIFIIILLIMFVLWLYNQNTGEKTAKNEN